MTENTDIIARLIVDRARQLTDQLVQQRGRSVPPFAAQEYAPLVGIKKIITADLGSLTDGVLLRLYYGWVIKLNERASLARRNFSCAHEIGHLLLNEVRADASLSTVEFRSLDTQQAQFANVRAKERLCNLAATELLMPHQVFVHHLDAHGLSIQTVERLAQLFGVSLQTAAIRMAEVSEKPCIALTWTPVARNSNDLRVKWFAGPGMKHDHRPNYLPVTRAVSAPSPLHEAYNSSKETRSFRTFKVGADRRLLVTQSKGFGKDDARYVLSLAFEK